MGPVSITSWYPKFNGSHVGLPPSSVHRMTGLGGKVVWTTVIAEIFVRVKISYSSVCQLSYARNFRTATVVSDTHAYVYGIRMLLNFVLSAKSTKYTTLIAYENLCDYSMTYSHRPHFRLSRTCMSFGHLSGSRLYKKNQSHRRQCAKITKNWKRDFIFQTILRLDNKLLCHIFKPEAAHRQTHCCYHVFRLLLSLVSCLFPCQMTRLTFQANSFWINACTFYKMLFSLSLSSSLSLFFTMWSN